MKFKHFLVRNGERLNSEYPISYKFLCENLVFHFCFDSQDLALKDFLGQPFPFPSEAIIDGFLLGGYPKDSDFQRFLDVAPREAIEQGVIGSDEDIRRGLWKNIVQRFSLTDSTFPPSSETLENVLKRFETKEDLEEAWTKENAPNFEEMVLKRLQEITILITSMELFPKVLARIIMEYAAPTRFSWFGPI